MGALLEGREQSLGVLRAAAGRQCSDCVPGSKGARDRVPRCRGTAALGRCAPSPGCGGQEESAGAAFQVSSPGSWKSISSSALQGIGSDRQQQYHLNQRQG